LYKLYMHLYTVLLCIYRLL